MINYCDLCDEEKEVRITSDRIRICRGCENKYSESNNKGEK